MERRSGITEIVAMDTKGVIGKNGDIPWKGRLRADMSHFKRTTMGHKVVVGRITWDSFDEKYKPLPGRENIVLTRDPEFSAVGCTVIHDPAAIIRMSALEEIFVIGGAEIYKIFLPFADRLLITLVETEVEGGDAFFPELPREWGINFLTNLFRQEIDDKNDFAFTVNQYTIQNPMNKK